jgi:hypothetical protein
VPSGKAFGIASVLLLLLCLTPLVLPSSFIRPPWDGTVFAIICLGAVPVAILTGIIAGLRHNRYWFLVSLAAAAYEMVLLAIGAAYGV